MKSSIGMSNLFRTTIAQFWVWRLYKTRNMCVFYFENIRTKWNIFNWKGATTSPVCDNVFEYDLSFLGTCWGSTYFRAITYQNSCAAHSFMTVTLKLYPNKRNFFKLFFAMCIQHSRDIKTIKTVFWQTFLTIK